MANFWDTVDELDLAEEEGIGPKSEAVAKYKVLPTGVEEGGDTPAHLLGAAKSSVFSALEAPGAVFTTVGAAADFPILGLPFKPIRAIGKAYRGAITSLAENDPDVMDFKKAVAENKEPMIGQWVGSLGTTSAGIAMRFIPYVGLPLTYAMYTGLQQEEIEQGALELGADKDTAKLTSWVAGPIASLPDMLGQGAMFKTFRGKALAKLLTAMGTASVTAKMVSGVGTELVKTGAIEGATEGAQGVVSYIAEQWAARSPDETLGKFCERMVAQRDEMWEIMKHDSTLGGLSGVFFGAMGLSAGAIASKRAEGKVAPPAITEAPIPETTEGMPESAYQESWMTKAHTGLQEVNKEWQDKLLVKEIVSQAEIEAAKDLQTNPAFAKLSRETQRIKGQIDFMERSWNAALERGREPSERLTNMINEKTTELNKLSTEQQGMLDQWKGRIESGLRESVRKEEAATLVEGKPKSPEEDMLIRPQGETWLDAAVRRVGGIPGVEEGAGIRARAAEEPSPIVKPTETMGPRREEIAVEKPVRVEEGPLKVTLPGGKGWVEGEITADKFYLHDVYVEKGERGAGFGLKAVKDTVDAYPDKEVWVASTSKGMDKIAEKLGFEKVAGKGRKPEGIPEQVSQNNANVWRKSPTTAKFAFGEGIKKGEVTDGIRYDGPWEGIGYAWTDMESKRSFTTKTTDAKEVHKRRGEITDAKLGLGEAEIERQRREVPSIRPEGKINGITREQAGVMLANGEDAVLEHIKRGVEEHGSLVMQDAIQNEMITALHKAKAAGADEVQKVVSNLRRMEPLVRDIVKTETAPNSQTVSDIQTSFAKIKTVLKNAPPTAIITDYNQIPKEHLTIMDESRPDWRSKNPKGVFIPTSKGPVIYIFANNVNSVGEAHLWYLHELVGHYGLHGAFGNQVNSILDRVWMSFGKSAEMQGVIEDYYGEAFDNNNTEHRRVVSEEFIANLARGKDLTQKQQTLLERVRQILRKVLSTLGFDVKMTEAELDSILAKSMEFVRGKGAQRKAGGKVGFAQGQEPAPFTYSALQKAVNLPDMPNKVQSIPNFLARKGVTKEEMAWTDLNGWLNENKVGDKVDKEALKAYVAAVTEETEIEEVELLGDRLATLEQEPLTEREKRANALKEFLEELNPLRVNDTWNYFVDNLELSSDNRVRLQKAKTNEEKIGIASKAPTENLARIFSHFQVEDILDRHLEDTNSQARFEGYFPEAYNYRELVLHLPNMGRGQDYHSPHWGGDYAEGDTINDVAFHILIDESPEEGAKTFNVLELQGDWPQDLGKKVGVPEFPFTHNWVKLGIQKMIRFAAQKGYDKVTFPHPDELIKHWGSDRYAWKRIPQISPEEFNKKTTVNVHEGNSFDRVADYLETLGMEIIQIGRTRVAGYSVEDNGNFIGDFDTYAEAVKNAVAYAKDRKVGRKDWQLSYTSQVGGHARGFDLQQEADRLAREGKFQQHDTTEVSTKQDIEDLMRRMRIVKSHNTPEYVARKVDQLWNKMQKSPESGALLPRKEGMEFAYGEKIPGALEKFAKQFGATVERVSGKFSITLNNKMRETAIFQGYARFAIDKARATEFVAADIKSVEQAADIEGKAKFAFEPIPRPLQKYIGGVQLTTEEKIEAFKAGVKAIPGNTIGEQVVSAWNSTQAQDFREHIRTKVFDKTNPIKVALGIEPWKMKRMEEGISASFDTLLADGVLKYDAQNKVLTCDTEGKGFVPWFKGLGKDGMKMLVWRIARRAENLEQQTIRVRDPKTGAMIERPKEILLTEPVRNEIYKWTGGRDRADFVQKSPELDKFFNSVLDVCEATGLINNEARLSWQQDFYLPYFRIFSDPDTREAFLISPNKSKKFISAQIRRLKGSEATIGNPLENILKSWQHLLTESIRNRSMQEAVDAAQGTGLIEELKYKDLHVFRQGTGKKRKTVYVSKKNQDNVVMFQRGGKPVYVAVKDPELFQALSGVDSPVLQGTIAKVFSLPKRVLTQSAVFGPAFKVANGIRDSMHTWLLDKDFSLFVDTIKGFRKVWMHDLDSVRCAAAGGLFGSRYVHTTDAQAVAAKIEKILKKEKGAIILNTWESAFGWWERFGAAFENAARVQSFAKKTRAGMRTLDAAFEVRDYLDFNMRGQSGVVQFLIHTTPFLGARLNGNYKLFNVAFGKDTWKNFWFRGTLLTAASLALWAAYKDDERYNSLEQWDKMSYYHFWVGNKHIRIPKPFEVGVFFSTLPVALAEVMNGTEDGKHAWDVMKYSFTQTFAVDLPQLVKPLVEQWANKSFFTKRPIVGEHLQGLLAGEQHDPWTSSTLQTLGKAVGVSPNRMEALIRGYFSTIGMTILGGLDGLTETFTAFPTEPTRRIDDWPLFGTFIKEAEHPRYVKQQTLFYEIADEYEKVTNTMRAYRVLGDPKAALELGEDNGPLVAAGKGMGKQKEELRKIRANMRIIIASPSLTADEKQGRLNNLIDRQNRIVTSAYQRAHRILKGG